jgi:hypothetical protein
MRQMWGTSEKNNRSLVEKLEAARQNLGGAGGFAGAQDDPLKNAPLLRKCTFLNTHIKHAQQIQSSYINSGTALLV